MIKVILHKVVKWVAVNIGRLRTSFDDEHFSGQYSAGGDGRARFINSLEMMDIMCSSTDSVRKFK